MWPFKRKKKKVDIDFKARTITIYDSLSTLEVFQIVELECRKRNINNPMDRNLVDENVVLVLDTGWNFTTRTFRSYHKKNKKRFTKMVEVKQRSISETYFSREDYKKKKK